jgi:hypothetical protein
MCAPSGRYGDVALHKNQLERDAKCFGKRDVGRNLDGCRRRVVYDDV